MQAVLTAIARAPELGSVSLAAVADALNLGPNGGGKLAARVDAAELFEATGTFEQLFDDRCKVGSDAYTPEMREWIVNQWVSDNFTRASENKRDEVRLPGYLWPLILGCFMCLCNHVCLLILF